MKLVKVPLVNGLGHARGCESMADEVVEALRNIHSSESGKVVDTQLINQTQIDFDNADVEHATETIFQEAKRCFRDSLFSLADRVFFLGGDHSVSFPLTRAFFETCRSISRESCLIVFDAHADCMKVVSEKAPTHEEWLRGLIDIGFPAENILIVGLRNVDPQERAFLQERNVKMTNIDAFAENLHEACDTLMEFVGGRELYVSLDIDVVDPTFAPATGYPEVGGLTSRQLLYVLHRLKKVKTLRAIDLVEINPAKECDSEKRTVALGAKIVAEML